MTRDFRRPRRFALSTFFPWRILVWLDGERYPSEDKNRRPCLSVGGDLSGPSTPDTQGPRSADAQIFQFMRPVVEGQETRRWAKTFRWSALGSKPGLTGEWPAWYRATPASLWSHRRRWIVTARAWCIQRRGQRQCSWVKRSSSARCIDKWTTDDRICFSIQIWYTYAWLTIYTLYM